MIEVHKEPIKIQNEFRGLMENCYFCKMPTRYWDASKKTPVCQDCGKSHDPSDIYRKNTPQPS